ncbi:MULTISPECIES: hypothetical protein [unclassified Pseudomonas]|uniref:hypothetical protein n=1 Tax=unclassified Pseudomonas TaxID=196821 RepID=UPI000BD98DC1|nr:MULTISPECIES: hypothetical protein [unclassified Pseudomonas]PVZ16284.1 hypothetical protein F474_01799 [Pseudomonas sp. URIL14HWK12:I12]PVZ25860.1 hypothetical protein F470_01311 [Pseudomonas sp. URIL14HWK12:I10]PVZ36616.1 hypothetical protein F472_01799 [Pseudomonas sp. URIL14HWK12:I11]SNZ13000.1 hypothetical protein SAMN05660463_02288 [Pseudomonas sp. URIL14HWK12:I9]
MKAGIVGLAALMLAGCGSRTVDYTPAPIGDEPARAAMVEVLQGLPGKRAPDQTYVTPDYFGYASGPLYAKPVGEETAASRPGVSRNLQVLVYFNQVAKVDLYKARQGRCKLVVRSGEGRALYRAVTATEQACQRFSDAVAHFKR